jgi:hypothetical protein
VSPSEGKLGNPSGNQNFSNLALPEISFEEINLGP